MDAKAKEILDLIKASGLATGFDSSRYNASLDFDQAAFEGTLDVVDVGILRASTGVADGTISKRDNMVENRR